MNLLPRLGVSVTQVDQTDPGAFARALTPRTRLILLESPSNPLPQITDLAVVADHTDVSAGVLAGPAEILDRIWDVALLTGAVLGPFDAWPLLRGLRTLPLRMPRHNTNGQALAEALHDHPAVARVHYPGLVTHPQHALAGKQMSGFGGLELAGGFAAADAFLGRLHYARRSASLGGVRLAAGTEDTADVLAAADTLT